MKQRDVVLELFRGVLLGVYGDEQGLHGLGGGAELVKRVSDRL
jgi:hypothetical protein